MWRQIEDLLAKGNIDKAKKKIEKINGYKMDTSIVHIFFKDLGIVKYSREELYGVMDVIGETVKGKLLHRHSLCIRLYVNQLPSVASSASAWASACSAPPSWSTSSP